MKNLILRKEAQEDYWEGDTRYPQNDLWIADPIEEHEFTACSIGINNFLFLAGHTRFHPDLVLFKIFFEPRAFTKIVTVDSTCGSTHVRWTNHGSYVLSQGYVLPQHSREYLFDFFSDEIPIDVQMQEEFYVYVQIHTYFMERKNS